MIELFEKTVRKAVDIARKKGYHVGIRRWFTLDPKQCDALGAIFVSTGIFPKNQREDYFEFLSNLISVPYDNLDKFSLGWDQYPGSGEWYNLGVRLRRELIYNEDVTIRDLEWLEEIDYESLSREDDTDVREDTEQVVEAYGEDTAVGLRYESTD